MHCLQSPAYRMASRNAYLTQILYDAATENNVSALRDLLTQDPLLLHRPPPSAYTTFPLHIACKCGYLEFVPELLRYNPRLSVDLDSNKSSPLHIASQNGHHELIRPLVSAMPSMCFSRDMLGMTPIHVAAMNGHLPVLEELLSVAPAAARERVGPVVGSVGGDTILHLCVKYNQLDALKMVIERAGEAGFMNAKNGDGDSILHLAVANKRLEMVKEMLEYWRLEKNAYNANGSTAMDLLGKNLNGPNRETYERLKQALKEGGGLTTREIESSSIPPTRMESKTNGILVAASFMAAVAFQAGINPPGGVWQDTQVSNSTIVTAANDVSQTRHTAGMAIMPQLSMSYHEDFVFHTSLCLGLSTCAMGILIMPVPRRGAIILALVMVMLAMLNICLAYSIAVHTLKYGEVRIDSAEGWIEFYRTLIIWVISPWLYLQEHIYKL